MKGTGFKQASWSHWCALSATIALALAFFGMDPHSASAETAMRRVTVEEAVGLARTQGPLVRAMEHAREAGVGEAAAARGALLPRVYMEERFMRTDNPSYVFASKLSEGRFTAADFAIGSLNHPSPINDYQTSLGVEQVLFAPQAVIGLRIANNETEARGSDLARSRDEAAYRAVEAYVGVQASAAFINAAGQALDDAREARRVAGLRLDTGMGLQADVLRTDAAIKDAEERMVRASAMNSNAKLALGLALGLDGPVDIAGPVAPHPVDKLDAYVAQVAQRPDLKAEAIRVKGAELSTGLARSRFLPTLGLSGTYQMNDHETAFGDEGKSFMVGVALRWDLLNGGSRLGELKAARERAAEAASRLDSAQHEAEFRVREAYSNVNVSASAVELEQSREALSAEARRLVMTRYENGLSTLSELLDAQAALDGARASVASKQAERLVAIARLMLESSTSMDTLGR